MGWLRRTWITVASEVAWRIPGRPQRLLHAFSLAERGSMVDVLFAAEATPRRDLRRKYFLHALDEGRHARVFADRVRALGRGDRAEAAVEDSGQLVEAGISGGLTLFERLGEDDFLAFVYVAEADAVEQFGVYLDRGLADPDTALELRTILKDEVFHVSYSRAELERMRKDGKPVDRMVRNRRLRRLWERYLRLTRDIGARVSGVWLTLLYFVALGPFRLVARLERGGWHPAPPPAPDALAAARAEG